jgi:hypothetical protein
MFQTPDYKVFIEKDDQCGTCELAHNQMDCPLIQAMGLNYVYLDDNGFKVTDCKLYKEDKIVTLKRIK